MLISWFRSIGFAAASSRQYGQTPYNPWGYTLAKHMLFDKIRDKLGLSECRFLAVSAAPISEDTLNFFTSLDMEIHGAAVSQILLVPDPLKDPVPAEGHILILHKQYQ